MQNKQAPAAENVKTNKAKRETISELAHRHLRDQNHTTTDEELRNATFEPSDSELPEDTSLFEVDNTTVVPGSAENEPLNANADVKRKDGDDKVPNPYSVLSK
jgi:hypothetical protein